MNTMILVSWGLAGAAVVLVGASMWFVRFRRSQIARMMEIRDEFFKSATALVEDESVPESLLARVMSIAETLDRPKIGRALFLRALSGRLRENAEHPSRGAVAFANEVRQLGEVQRQHFTSAAVSALLAATYMNFFIGPWMRRMMLYSIREDETQAQIVMSSITADIHHNSAAA